MVEGRWRSEQWKICVHEVLVFQYQCVLCKYLFLVSSCQTVVLQDAEERTLGMSAGHHQLGKTDIPFSFK